jgi:hypothetical protein
MDRLENERNSITLITENATKSAVFNREIRLSFPFTMAITAFVSGKYLIPLIP